jgi:hypothetical protein
LWTKVAASTNKEVDGHIPNYPNLPPQLICQLHDVTMHVRDFFSLENFSAIRLLCLYVAALGC